MESIFTKGQWEELERQALIYKYMAASIPVPISLLLPISTTTNSLEEGERCKRTDGKKWRCSKQVAPNQKYCEKHINRGRPRSRKHVEPQQQQLQSLTINNKKPRRSSINNIISLSQISPSSSNTTTNYLPYYSSSTFTPHSRNFEWMMRSEKEQHEEQWLHLMEITENPDGETFFNPTTTNLFVSPNQNHVVSSEQSSRRFIDAWSKTTLNEENDNIRDDLSPSSLSLSMGNWWVSPLAEVLRPPSIGFSGDSPAVMSPSGVLQSDSSNCSSPNKPEIALF